MRRLLLLGHRGKLGTALGAALRDDFEIVGASTDDFDAGEPASARSLVHETKPDVVVNCVAFMGLDACELNPGRAFAVNTLFPRALAGAGARRLVHFSTEGVFDGRGPLQGLLTELDLPNPPNIYGFTKYMSEGPVLAAGGTVFRLPVLFGAGRSARVQFLERMVRAGREGAPVRVAIDMITTPTWSADVAKRVRKALSDDWEPGLYHIANSGEASLFEMVEHAFRCLGIGTPLEPATHGDFPCFAARQLRAGLTSDKLFGLRPWQEAMEEYCAAISERAAA